MSDTDELMKIQSFIAGSSIESLNVGILGRLARLYIDHRNLIAGCDLFPELAPPIRRDFHHATALANTLGG